MRSGVRSLNGAREPHRALTMWDNEVQSNTAHRRSGQSARGVEAHLEGVSHEQAQIQVRQKVAVIALGADWDGWGGIEAISGVVSGDDGQLAGRQGGDAGRSHVRGLDARPDVDLQRHVLDLLV